MAIEKRFRSKYAKKKCNEIEVESFLLNLKANQVGILVKSL